MSSSLILKDNILIASVQCPTSFSRASIYQYRRFTRTSGNDYEFTFKRLCDCIFQELSGFQKLTHIEIKRFNVSRFVFFLIQALEVNDTVEILNLDENDLEEKDVIYIAIFLSKNPRLRQLYLAGNTIGKNCTILAQGLCTNYNLQILDLEKCRIADFTQFFSVLRSNFGLKKLMIRYNIPIWCLDQIRACASLVTIHINLVSIMVDIDYSIDIYTSMYGTMISPELLNTGIIKRNLLINNKQGLHGQYEMKQLNRLQILNTIWKPQIHIFIQLPYTLRSTIFEFVKVNYIRSIFPCEIRDEILRFLYYIQVYIKSEKT